MPLSTSTPVSLNTSTSAPVYDGTPVAVERLIEAMAIDTPAPYGPLPPPES